MLSFFWDGYHEFSQFRKDYRTKFDKNVYVGPYVRWKWDVGAEVTEGQVEKALKELEIYRPSFNDTVFHPEMEIGSSAILILPCGSGEPKYRDDQNKPPAPVSAYSMNYIASMIGLPQLVIPVGQVPFDSRVSGRKEYLPVVGTMVGAKGSDLMLFNLAKAALDKAKWPTKLATRRYAFKLGGGTRNVASDLENQDHHL